MGGKKERKEERRDRVEEGKGGRGVLCWRKDRGKVGWVDVGEGGGKDVKGRRGGSLCTYWNSLIQFGWSACLLARVEEM